MTDETKPSARAVPRTKSEPGPQMPTIVLLAGDGHDSERAREVGHEKLPTLSKLCFLTEVRLDRLQRHDIVVAITRGDGGVDPKTGESRGVGNIELSKPIKLSDYWDAAAEAGGVVEQGPFMAALAKVTSPAFPKAKDGILRLGYT